METKHTATMAANMRHAARNRETVNIGGGTFGPDELRSCAVALAAHDDLVAALEAARSVMLHNLPSGKYDGTYNQICAALAKASQ